jgi:hypothetical protein
MRMREHTKIKAFELADAVTVKMYRKGLKSPDLELKTLETEKVLGALLRSVQM